MMTIQLHKLVGKSIMGRTATTALSRTANVDGGLGRENQSQTEYQVPKVWSPSPSQHGLTIENRPSAAPRTTLHLPGGNRELHLFSNATPNGKKVTILLAELGLLFDSWAVDILHGDQLSSGFIGLNPNGKIPAMIDYNTHPPARLFESGSILLYLAQRENRFLGDTPDDHIQCMNWLFWQIGIGPQLGSFWHFYKYAAVKIRYAIDRYAMETKRILDVLDRRMSEKRFVAGDSYTIADMAIYPPIKHLESGGDVAEFLAMSEYNHVQRWLKSVGSRDAVREGMNYRYTNRMTANKLGQAPGRAQL